MKKFSVFVISVVVCIITINICGAATNDASAGTNNIQEKKDMIYFQAHRGGRMEAPEHTMETYRYAWDLGGIPEADMQTDLCRPVPALPWRRRSPAGERPPWICA